MSGKLMSPSSDVRDLRCFNKFFISCNIYQYWSMFNNTVTLISAILPRSKLTVCVLKDCGGAHLKGKKIEIMIWNN